MRLLELTRGSGAADTYQDEWRAEFTAINFRSVLIGLGFLATPFCKVAGVKTSNVRRSVRTGGLCRWRRPSFASFSDWFLALICRSPIPQTISSLGFGCGIVVLKVRWDGQRRPMRPRMEKIFTAAAAASGGNDGEEGREGRWPAIVAALRWICADFLLFDRTM